MAKISELTDRQLSANLNKYTQLIIDEPENEKNEKIVAQIKKEITKRATHDAGDVSIPVVKETVKAKKVEKFHSDEVDYSSYKAASFKSRALALVIDGVFYNIISQMMIL